MTTRRPRRRREAVPSPSLPRPGRTAARQSDEKGFMSAEELAQRRPVHHVVRDYSYVRKDLVAIAAVSAATLAFIVGAAFLN